jgi:hypothetical protein
MSNFHFDPSLKLSQGGDVWIFRGGAKIFRGGAKRSPLPSKSGLD